MIHNQLRIGNFTSSEIGALMCEGKAKGSFGKPAMTYIAEKRMERRLKRALNDITTAKPLIWGKLLEQRAFDLLGLGYTLMSQDTIVHPTIDYWSGSPDGRKEEMVIDIKCPMTLKSFCQFADCIKDGSGIDGVRENHPDGEKYYWQLVSNAILMGVNRAELIIYLPYKSELQDIRNSCEETDMSPNKVAWIAFAEDDDLPYLLDGGYYQNCYAFTFEVPQADKGLLTSRVIEAGKLLLL